MAKFYCKKFNSLYEYSEYLKAAKVQQAFIGSEDSHSTNNSKWYGTKTYEEAENYLTRGCHSLANELNGKMQGIHSSGVGIFRDSITRGKTVTGVYGNRVNIGAYLAGSQKCMMRKVRQRVQHPVLNILYNNGATGGYSASELTEVNARVLRAIQIAEMERGIRINLYAAQCSSESEDIAGPVVRIKDSDSIMDIEKIAYPLISPSMLRRQKFRFLETYPNLPKRWVGGYGCSLSDKEKLLQVADFLHIQVDICLTFYDARQMTDRELVDYVTNTRS